MEADRLGGVVVDPRDGRIVFRDYAESWLTGRAKLAQTTREDYGRLIDSHPESDVR
jgi:hypothetical protein